MPRTTTRVGRPGFIADHASIDRTSGRQIDWANVAESFRTTGTAASTITTTGAALGAPSVPVAALPIALPAGAVLNFMPGAGKFAKLTAPAAAGATTLTVEALPTALANGDTAQYGATGKKMLPAGTVVGSLLGAGRVSPRIVTTNPAIGLLETNAIEDDPDAALSGYGVIVGGVVYEALLPDSTGTPRTLSAAIKTELANAGTGFSYEPYADSRA